MALRVTSRVSPVSAPAEDARTERRRWIGECETAYDKVYRALVAMGASPSDASDAVQDAVEHALRRAEPADNALAWLFVVAMRSWKRQRWRQRIFRPLDVARGETRSEERDDTIALFVELAKLTERQRTVLVARYALGLSQKEIADLLHVTAGTVGAIASQASKKLRKQLGEDR